MMNRPTITILLAILALGTPKPAAAQLAFHDLPPIEVPSEIMQVAATEIAPATPPGVYDEATSVPRPPDDRAPKASGTAPTAESIPWNGDVEPMEVDAFSEFGTGHETAFSPFYDEMAVPADVGGQEIYSTGTLYWSGTWFVQQDAVVMMRSLQTDRVIARAYDATLTTNNQGQQNVTNIPTVHSLNLSSAPMRYQPGMRFTLGKILGIDSANRQHTLEATFLGLFDWDNSATLVSPFEENNVSTTLAGDPFTIDSRLGVSDAGSSNLINVPGFTTSHIHSLDYTADFNTFEVNYRLTGRPARDRVALQPDGTWVRYATSSQMRSVFAGLRLGSMNEALRYTSSSIGNIPDRGLYEVRLNNRLIGLQVGGQMAERHHNWSVGLRTKMGGLLNFARRNSLYDGFDVVDTDGDNLADTQDSRRLRDELHDEHLALLAEAGVFGTYELGANSALRLSYDVMYLTGVAMAAPNMQLGRGFGPLNVESGILMHGLSFGYERVW